MSSETSGTQSWAAKGRREREESGKERREGRNGRMNARSTMLLGEVVSVFPQAGGGEFCPAGKSDTHRRGVALAPQALSFEHRTFPGI